LNPNNPNAEARSKALRAAARAIGLQIHVLNATNETEIESSFATFAQGGAKALLIGDDPFFESQRARLITLAARHALPAIYDSRQYVTAGGLASYGTSFADIYRQAGSYIGKILSGAKPAELPVQQPTKFELAINLKTAKALGLEVPPTLLARADEVIE
jgi:putative ABC transport system substrate-binding protein